MKFKNVLIAFTLASSLQAETTEQIPAPANPSDSDRKGWTVDGSFLYWNAKADGFTYAQKVKAEVENSNMLINATVKTETLPFDTWDPGFQIGLGYIFPQRDQWHARLSWTRFNTENEQSKTEDSDDLFTEFFSPQWLPFLTGTVADKASADWHLDFNTLDLELDRRFFVGEWLSLCPRIGLRAAWIDQDFHTKYHSFFLTESTVITANTSFKSDQDFSGVGLKMGADAKFYLTQSWSILGNLSASLLWGRVSIKEKINGFIDISSLIGVPEIVSAKESFNVIRPNLESQLGLEWQKYFQNNKYRLGISALYTFAYWFRQNMIFDEIVTITPNMSQPALQIRHADGDLQLQGLNIKAEFDF